MSNNSEARPTAELGQPRPDQGRREALRKIGKFGAYTAPAMLTMLVAEKAIAQSET